MTTQRTFEPHEFAPYAEANNICRHCDRGRYALHHEQPRPEQVGSEASRLSAGEQAVLKRLRTSTPCEYNQHEHCTKGECECDCHDAPAAPERGERWRVVREIVAPIVAEIRAGDVIIVGAVSTELAEQIVREHEQHSTLIAQRERLLEALKGLRNRHRAKARKVNFGDCGCDDCAAIEPVLTTIEQEGTAR